MSAEVFDDRRCILGEGPLWHPERQQLFWFDIMRHRLLSRDASGPLEWRFDEPVSAAGWVDDNTLLIASASGLWRFDLRNGSKTQICGLERNNAVTRSNDGRADPWGGFWIGTMGRNAEPGAGAIYRFYQGQLRKLVPGITISNAICFAPNRSCAYFTDTATQRVMRAALDRNGWPDGDPQVFLDLSADALHPDGAVVDKDGTIWIAQWGAARVTAYAPDGTFLRDVAVPALHATCPAFGGAEFRTLYVTSARQGLPADVAHDQSPNGQTFAVPNIAQGLPEPQVIL
ncbi:SMP-30/gluconolactonase/LRE family protein [Roseobacter sinensis]|uniref:SMP-30/gluconolactonase/LRE family protein n=1 Tax=Roseobacter sinensis TaxID=2931391 RepID=A0ABT3BHX6_9RHOB|nr:SMP-30/gluconolactonase/LRE family protein [Roseobacter sp. WL0113]MCV3273172.1 SMP-30/gluconolactonase/LRE family protein [Roseobacter sp. WL0113]